jgi:glycine hydroxymethyltransferase
MSERGDGTKSGGDSVQGRFQSTANQVSEVLEMIEASGAHYGSGLPMIASENVISPLVTKAINSDLHGRYAEGLPGKRYYQGCDDFDDIESLGISLARDAFDCNFANIQPTSGTVANMGALKALAKPGDRITAVSTADGGHISHAQMGAVGQRGLNLTTYPWDEERMEPDIDASAALIREVEPTLALFGQSVFLFPTPLEELADAAHEVGARVMYDGAHVLGLIAGGCFQDPLKEGADVMTGSSHKTFPGPQGGFLLSNSDDEKFQMRLNNSIFPGVCSSYHLHHVAGKVVALSEFQQFGADYATDTVANAKAFGEAMAAAGFDVLAESRGYTTSHQILTRHGEIDSGAGRLAAQKLEDAGIITNMNMLPGDSKAMSPSGLRLGVQELTRHGMGRDEMQDVANLYARVLIRDEDPAAVKRDVRSLRSDFTEVQYCFPANNAD